MGFFSKLFDSHKIEKKYNEQGFRIKEDLNRYLAIVQKRYNPKDFINEIASYANWQCPYCSHSFEKEVTRKRKCPQCQQVITKRSHFITKENMLLKSDSLTIFDAQKKEYFFYKWAIDFAEEMSPKKSDLIKIAELENKSDVISILWRMAKRDAKQHSENNKWGLYRNSLLKMVAIAREEGNILKELDYLSVVCFFDINGPTNRGNLEDEYLKKKYPQFDKQFSDFVPGIVQSIKELIENENIPLHKLNERFIRVCDKQYKVNMLYKPNEAWDRLETEINRICDINNQSE